MTIPFSPICIFRRRNCISHLSLQNVCALLRYLEISLELAPDKYSVFVTEILQCSNLLHYALKLAKDDILVYLNVLELCSQVLCRYSISLFHTVPSCLSIHYIV